jgi:ribosomal protein L22
MRRGWYGARGQFKPITKRMSHVRVVLSDGKA